MDIFTIGLALIVIGLALIVIGWLVQLYYLFKGKKEIQPAFLGLYMIGVALLIYTDYSAGESMWMFESLTFVGAGLVLVKLLTSK